MSLQIPSFELLCPFQLAWLRDETPLRVAEKSRRIGWTWIEALGATMYCVEKPRRKYWLSSADQSAGEEFIDYIEEWSTMFNAVARVTDAVEIIEDDKINVRVATFANGSRVTAGSSNPKFFRSKGGRVGWDEAAFHQRGREIYKAAHATAMYWGYPMSIWSSHNGEGSYFNTQIVEPVRKGKLRASLHRVTVIDAVEQGIVERIRMRKDGLDYVPAPDARLRQEWLDELRATVPDEDIWREEYLCQPSTDAGAYLSYELIRSAVTENLQLYPTPADLPEGGTYYAGYDVGRRHDLSVLWVGERVGDVIVTRMLRVLDRQSFAVQQGLLDALMRRRDVRRICVDETGLGMQLAETMVERYPGRAEGVTLSGPVKATLGARVKDTLSDHRLRIPATVDWDAPSPTTDPAAGRKPPAKRTRRDDWLIEDLHKTRKTTTVAGNVRLSAESDSDGHADGMWALGLMLEAASDAQRPLPKPLARKPAGW